MQIKPELEPEDFRLIVEALNHFACHEMGEVKHMKPGDERGKRVFRAGLAAGIAHRLLVTLEKEGQ